MSDAPLEYKVNAPMTADQFIDVLERSTLAARRPVHDRAAMEAMVRHGNLCVTAWHGDTLVGVARSLTDFHYACFLSDLAVDKDYQRSGIGVALIAHTQRALGPHCKIRLLAAPAAAEYYPRIGFERNANCWELEPGREPG
ncbi:MAG: GNAT family N-acetyltransferase [Rhodospirillaceae bacterium]